MLQTKEDILQGAKASFIRVQDWLDAHPDEKFGEGPEGKWTTAEHIAHLTIVNKQLAKGLSAPKLVLRSTFGKPNRPGRNYEEIVNRYKEKLAGLPQDFENPSAGKSASAGEKAERVAAYKESSKKFLQKLGKWKDKDLDNYLMPHPLLGKMTVREMMLWTVYHNEHHLKNLTENY